MKSLLIISLLVIISLPVALNAQDQMTCSSCGKPITEGKYMMIEGKTFHFNHFVCAMCRKPIGENKYFKDNGNYYDSACYIKNFSPKCAYCGLPSGMEWITYDNKTYHNDCYENHVAMRCSLCGGIISGNYLKDQWGNVYHESHRDEPRCLYCGRLLSVSTDGGERYSDGRTICGLCLKTSVKSKDEAEKIMYEVKDYLTSIGIDIDKDKIPLKLIDSRKMAQVRIDTNHDQDLQGFTFFEKSSYLYGLISQKKFNIYILNGLPQINYTGTIAHELMHVWLGLNAPMEQYSAMVEGTCNYISYLILQHIGGPEAEDRIQQMLASKDPDYGIGFREVIEQVKERSLEGWLDYLKDNTTAPW